MIDRRTFSTMLTAGAASSFFGRSGEAQAQPAVGARNVVLVHGAYADGSCWSEVIGRLQRAGLMATAVQNPLTSLADDVAATRRILALQNGPTVLVGHSWAGTVISETGSIPKSLPLSTSLRARRMPTRIMRHWPLNFRRRRQMPAWSNRAALPSSARRPF